MTEKQLAEKFIDYFNDGYEVYPEVPAGGGVIDFVATDGTIQIGCEVKTSFNLKVMEQAARKRHAFHYTYICVPRRKDYHFRLQVMNTYGIGVILIDSLDNIFEKQQPRLNRNAYCPDLKEYMKLSISGTQSDRVTAFGWTVKQIERYLKHHGPTHIEKILENIDYHYNTLSTAKSSLRKWIKNGVIDSIEWDSAILKLKEKD
jgi:hypothetical protein